MSISIRPLTPADQDLLWEMLYHAVFVPAGSAPLPRSILTEPEIAPYAADWGRPHDAGFAAESAGQPIGAAWLRLFAGYGYVDDHTPELSIALLPGYRGQGIGTRLMDALLTYAQARYPGVSLSVEGANPARRLYERLGFAVVGQNGFSLTMQKTFARKLRGKNDNF